MNIILSSSSKARRALLQALHLPFTVASPDIDETAKENESAEDLVCRLAYEKAMANAINFPDAVIIASDQVAVVNHEILGKPLHYDEAVRQLRLASDATMTFVNGLCVLNTITHSHEVHVETCAIEFKPLTQAMIDDYLAKAKPYECAGSIKAEDFAITLIKRFIGNDITCIHGLPLIRLTSMLEHAGVKVIGG